MKKLIFPLAILGIVLLASCTKDTPTDISNQNVTIRYEFNATMAGNYGFKVVTDTIKVNEIVNTAVWSKTFVVADDKAKTETTSFTVYPPLDWYGTNNQANGTLKIFINNVEAATQTSLFVGVDRPSGVTISANY